LVWSAADNLRAGGVTESEAAEEAPSQEDAERYRALVEEMQGSLSWRVTAPLRLARARLRNG